MIAAQSTPPAADTGEITLARIERQHKARRTAFWNVQTGELISDHGNGANIGPDAPLYVVLDLFAGMSPATRPRTLYLMGGDRAENTPRRSWWAQPAARDSARDGMASWRYDGYELAAHAATGGAADATENAGQYERDGVRVDVRMSALWFPGLVGAGAAREARDNWRSLNETLRRRFDAHATLLATPAATGRDLLQRSLPRGVRYPVAPSAFRDLLYTISGQGRFEFCPAPDMAGRQIAGLYTLDARWMYAACVRGLPTGTPHRRLYPDGADALEAFAGYTPAWYRVSIRVPDGWAHTGLIAQRLTSGDQAGERIWPAEPGQWIRDVWTSGAELKVALSQGWRVLIYERWAYEPDPTGRTRPLPDPTRDWIQTLREMRMDAAHNGVIAGAIRHLVLDTVGTWHKREGRKLRITPIAEYPGAAAGAQLHHVDRAAKLAYWYEPKPLSRDDLAWQRPEWSATTWNRSAARENRAGLRVPRGELVAYRADGLVTCVEPAAAQWLDDGQPGTFRRKSDADVIGPLRMPATQTAMQELRRAAAQTAK